MCKSGSTVDQLRRANIELVKRFIRAINDSWNIDEMRELVSDDFVFVIPFAPTWFTVRYEGREQALAFLDSVRDLMDPENLYDLRIDTCAAYRCDVIAEYRSATRMNATGLPYCNDYIGRFRIRDGTDRVLCRIPGPDAIRDRDWGDGQSAGNHIDVST